MKNLILTLIALTAALTVGVGLLFLIGGQFTQPGGWKALLAVVVAVFLLAFAYEAVDDRD